MYNLARDIEESIFIRVNNPTLNRNIGKFNIPHIWERVLLNTPGLNFKGHMQAVGHVNSNNSNTSYQIIPTSPSNLNNAPFPSHLLMGSEHGHGTS